MVLLIDAGSDPAGEALDDPPEAQAPAFALPCAIGEIVEPAPPGAALRAPTVRPPPPREVPFRAERRNLGAPILFGLLATLALAPIGWNLASNSRSCDPAAHEIGKLAANALAERIVRAESNGVADAKNSRSSATGPGQFLNDTWIELISVNRPELKNATGEKILELRRDPELSREMVVRLAERNARVLATRCLPITPGTLYLAHFAGGGGAASVLSAPDHADAATTMAKGDSKGKLTREIIVKANPFLKSFTVADLKDWADRKMRGTRLYLARQ